MKILLTLIFGIIVAFFTSHIGSEKGYSSTLCGVAGFFGGIGTLILLLILPDQTEEQRRQTQLQKELAALRQRIADLENARPATSDAEPDDT